SSEVDETLAVARAAYAERRKLLAAVLDAHGIEHPDGDGINVWVRVADERAALVHLAMLGLGAAPGGPFMVRDDEDHLRVTIGNVRPDDAERIAHVLVEAAGVVPTSGGGR
ncbi:MAG: hypothetical protein WD225_15385, partial [Ilumatobacteraceae bacterium]